MGTTAPTGATMTRYLGVFSLIVAVRVLKLMRPVYPLTWKRGFRLEPSVASLVVLKTLSSRKRGGVGPSGTFSKGACRCSQAPLPFPLIRSRSLSGVRSLEDGRRVQEDSRRLLTYRRKAGRDVLECVCVRESGICSIWTRTGDSKYMWKFFKSRISYLRRAVGN